MEPTGGAPGRTAADPAADVLEKARVLAEDLALNTVKAWKQKNPGMLAIGHLPVYTPRVMFEAMGCLPVAVFGAGEIDIIKGDSYFQSYICHIPRSTVELGLGGQLDVLDGMVFPSICDVIRNLGGMWKLMFPAKMSAYLDLPQNFAWGLGGRFYMGELKRIAAETEKRGARPLTEEGLRRAIKAENARRRALAELDALRREEPHKARASEAYLVARAGGVMLAEEHEKLIREFLAAARKRTGRPMDNVRVVVAGSFCEQPPLGLIKTLEKAGCDILEDDFQLGLRMIDGDIELKDGMPALESLARAFTERGRDTASRYVPDDTKGQALIRRVKECKADGVVFAAASFCDPALLDQPMLEHALTRAGIPHTSFKFAENTGQFQVIREQAGAFSDSVRLWGGQAA
ncbi:MAG: benzoyl-CoA reductase subunit C [Deltaproteobacteria bacterium]|nr:benzoyl-CoA reductase subunit C [Deltaproteobacteria bacterium]